ncbi:MAG: NAD(P)H-dependent glycerol-3-phosphate dehydrogenase [Sandaracinaceae bacterium]
MPSYAVIGGGAWGTALAAHAVRMGHPTRLWARETQVVEAIRRDHQNPLFLPAEPLPPELQASNDPEEVLRGADAVLLVPPSTYFREVSAMVAPHVGPSADVLIATKGIEESSLSLMTAVLAETMPHVGPDRVGVFSGPTFAKEVVRGRPTDIVVASRSQDLTRRVQLALHSPYFRTYASSDPTGAQVGGALKNVLAVATGAADGLGFGHNARAGLITRGLAELARLGVRLDADPLTFLGLSGVGDLILTCTGDLSRNRQLGMEVARGAKPREYLASRRSVAEGFWTSAAAHRLAQREGVEMPISEQVYRVLHEDRPLAEAAESLLGRSFKDELYGIREVWSPIAGSSRRDEPPGGGDV